MTPPAEQLALAPERCDNCGRCVPACPRRALKVGGGYVYVDASLCDNCLACVSACGRQVITSRSRAKGGGKDAGGTARVVVGSRAQAKALRHEASGSRRDATPTRRKAAPGERSKRAPERREGAVALGWAVTWTMADAVIVLTVMAATLLTTSAIASSGLMLAMPPSGQAGARAALLVAFFVVQMVTLVMLSRAHGAKLVPALGLSPKFGGIVAAAQTGALVLALTLLTRFVSYFWGVFARAIGWNPPDSSALTSVFGKGGAGLILAVVALIILGPIAEELIFRGALLGAFGARWGKWPAIVGTAVLFALYHATAWTLVPMFLLGLALGWLAWTRRSPRSAIVLHALYNGLVVAAAYLLAS